MKMRSVAPMKIAKIGYIVVSVLFCIAGILFIALPEISTKIVGIEIGIAAIVFGIVKLIGYFSKDLYRLFSVLPFCLTGCSKFGLRWIPNVLASKIGGLFFPWQFLQES